jgi:L-rhamnose-H+ transport protein
MASIMIFGKLWGLALKEWRGAGTRTMRLLAMSPAVLVTSTLVVGYGYYLSTFAHESGTITQVRGREPGVDETRLLRKKSI